MIASNKNIKILNCTEINIKVHSLYNYQKSVEPCDNHTVSIFNGLTLKVSTVKQQTSLLYHKNIIHSISLETAHHSILPEALEVTECAQPHTLNDYERRSNNTQNKSGGYVLISVTVHQQASSWGADGCSWSWLTGEIGGAVGRVRSGQYHGCPSADIIL